MSKASRTLLLGLSYPKFATAIEESEMPYNKLMNLRKFLIKTNEVESTPKLKKKIRFVERKLKSSLEVGVTMRRRIPETGTRVVSTHTYKDTPSNRKRERVGVSYEKVSYKDADYEEIQRKRFRKYKTKKVVAEGEDGASSKPKRRNLWIEAMKIAKANVDAPALSIVYKEVKDPSNPKQVIGHQVYCEAIKQLQILKSQAADAAATSAAATETAA